MDTNILLENGTNELEVLEFRVSNNHYGINVAKIREILPYQEVTHVPNAHPHVEGIFMPRDEMITVIDLTKSLGYEHSGNYNNDMLIITNFNQLKVAFHVNEVLGINRVSWAEIIKPDATLNSKDGGTATGVIKVNGKLVIILDFEKIVTDISPETGLKVSDIDRLGIREKNTTPILIAEDSHLLSKLLVESLHKAGYSNTIVKDNGQEAWDFLLEVKENDEVDEKVKCIITDIEMPLMDGHRLTRLVKNDDRLKGIPLVIFSSLINDEMRRKGIALGADAQLSKPEIGGLVEIIDKLIK